MFSQSQAADLWGQLETQILCIKPAQSLLLVMFIGRAMQRWADKRLDRHNAWCMKRLAEQINSYPPERRSLCLQFLMDDRNSEDDSGQGGSLKFVDLVNNHLLPNINREETN